MITEFKDLQDFTIYIKHVIVGYIHDPDVDDNLTDFLNDPQFIWTFNYGSMLYHPDIAKDHDVCIILSDGIDKIFYRIFSDEIISQMTIGGYPVDIKTTVFSGLDSTEMMELDYCIKQATACYIPICLKMSHAYLLQESVEMLVDMHLLEKKKVRHSISQKCSNSFVKAKKKLTVEKDYDRYCSMKSLFHSIRMAIFAYQYGKDGVIKPSSCRSLYEEIVKDYEENDDEAVLQLISTKYKKMHNEKMRLFRLFYPK